MMQFMFVKDEEVDLTFFTISVDSLEDASANANEVIRLVKQFVDADLVFYIPHNNQPFVPEPFSIDKANHYEIDRSIVPIPHSIIQLIIAYLINTGHERELFSEIFDMIPLIDSWDHIKANYKTGIQLENVRKYYEYYSRLYKKCQSEGHQTKIIDIRIVESNEVCRLCKTEINKMGVVVCTQCNQILRPIAEDICYRHELDKNKIISIANQNIQYTDPSDFIILIDDAEEE